VRSAHAEDASNPPASGLIYNPPKDIPKRGDDHVAQTACTNQPTGIPNNRILDDLQAVNLYVIGYPSDYNEALKCHGREEECLDNRGVKKSSAGWAQEKQYLIDIYQDYPAPLHPDSLVRIFSDTLNDRLMPFVVRGPDCKIPEIKMLIDAPYKEQMKAVDGNLATLTVALHINIVNTSKPHIAVLTTNYYRPDPAHTDFFSQVNMGHSIAIPLDLPDDQIERQIKRFARSFEVLVDLPRGGMVSYGSADKH
jgi:hypothetical protein